MAERFKPPSPTKENEEFGMFSFESEHLALKGNKDYLDLIKTIIQLEAQRNKAIGDIDKLVELEKQLKADPISFIGKIKRNEVEFPEPIQIAELPVIDWGKYNEPVSEESLQLINSETEPKELPKEPVGKIPKKETFSSTFNQPWTPEEQKKLEELLVTYPPEAVEMRRFKKIARALGNRTVQQVTSRVQKYFMKLRSAGLPIPGRIPKTLDRKRSHRHQRLNHLLYRPSTFFPEMHIPVVMADNEEVPGPNTPPPAEQPTQPTVIIQEETLDPKIEVQLKIDLLRQVRLEKDKQMKDVYMHVGYKCDMCEEDPLVGVRWHCITCNEKSIDFCMDCIITQMNLANCHPLTHKFAPISGEMPTENLPIEQIPTSTNIQNEIKEQSTLKNKESCTYLSLHASVKYERVGDMSSQKSIPIKADPDSPCNSSVSFDLLETAQNIVENPNSLASSSLVTKIKEEPNCSSIPLEHLGPSTSGTSQVKVKTEVIDSDSDSSALGETGLNQTEEWNTLEVLDDNYISYSFVKGGRNYLDPNYQNHSP